VTLLVEYKFISHRDQPKKMFVAWLMRYFWLCLDCDVHILETLWHHLPYQLLHYEARMLCNHVMENAKKRTWITRGPVEGELKDEMAQRWRLPGGRFLESDSLCVVWEDKQFTLEVQRILEDGTMSEEVVRSYVWAEEEGTKHWWSKHISPASYIFGLEINQEKFWEVLLSLLRTFK
jgi:hypothetical protein